MTQTEKKPRRWRAAMVIAAIALVLGAVIWWLVEKMSAPEQGKKKRAVQEIALIKPPPPPPPPKEQPPPPKEEIKEKIEVPKEDVPQDKPSQAPPPGPDLAVDAAGTGSGDGFGLVGKKGGSDLIGGGGNAGSKFAWYGALIKDRIQDAISKDKRMREAQDYRLLVNVWVSPSGAVTRVDLLGSTQNIAIDNALKQLLKDLPPLKEGAPADMPQPIKLRIANR